MSHKIWNKQKKTFLKTNKHSIKLPHPFCIWSFLGQKTKSFHIKKFARRQILKVIRWKTFHSGRGRRSVKRFGACALGLITLLDVQDVPYLLPTYAFLNTHMQPRMCVFRKAYCRYVMYHSTVAFFE
jgi:hypothetical protein